MRYENQISWIQQAIPPLKQCKAKPPFFGHWKARPTVIESPAACFQAAIYTRAESTTASREHGLAAAIEGLEGGKDNRMVGSDGLDMSCGVWGLLVCMGCASYRPFLSTLFRYIKPTVIDYPANVFCLYYKRAAHWIEAPRLNDVLCESYGRYVSNWRRLNCFNWFSIMLTRARGYNSVWPGERVRSTQMTKKNLECTQW